MAILQSLLDIKDKEVIWMVEPNKLNNSLVICILALNRNDNTLRTAQFLPALQNLVN